MAYVVDIVLCIDGTSSMASHIERIKETAIKLLDGILLEARTRVLQVSNLRVKIIVFRDYLTDGEYAIQMTDFSSYPEEKESVVSLLNEISTFSSGDGTTDGMEALAYAMQSDWQAPCQGARRRQIIAVWTDASCHQLGYGKSSMFYDPALPEDFDELTDWWENEKSERCKMHAASKRLVLFAPRVAPWTTMEEEWDNVIMYPTPAGQGMREGDCREIIHLLVGD